MTGIKESTKHGLTDPAEVVQIWADPSLGNHAVPWTHVYQSQVSQTEAQTNLDIELILDSPFVSEEVKDAIKHLNRNSLGGSDSFSPNH